MTLAAVSGESLERLLAILDPDRERAGRRFEHIRHRLVKFFTWHAAAYPDELADETIDRVMKQLGDGRQIGGADPTPYFFGVARNVLRESWRRRPADARSHPAPVPAPERRVDDDLAEARSRCLDRCLERLAEPSRHLVLAYYSEGEGGGIPARKRLARELGISIYALRVRVHRLRARLEACVRACLPEVTEWTPPPSRSERKPQ